MCWRDYRPLHPSGEAVERGQPLGTGNFICTHAVAHWDDLQDRIEWTPNALTRPLSAAPAEDQECVSLGLFERNPVSSIQPFPREHDPDFAAEKHTG